MNPTCVVNDCPNDAKLVATGPHGIEVTVCIKHYNELKAGKQLVFG